MDTIDKLFAMEEIKALKARYFRYLDTKDWKGFEDLFTADAVFDISDDVPGCIVVGATMIANTASGPLTGSVTVHHGHCPEIEITSDTSAAGVWAMEDNIVWGAGSTVPIKTLHGYGHYVETYERRDGRWYIKTLKLRRLRVDKEFQRRRLPHPGNIMSSHADTPRAYCVLIVECCSLFGVSRLYWRQRRRRRTQ